MVGDDLKQYTFRNIMNILMGETSDDVDKRQGGLFFDIYTAVANFGQVIFSQIRTGYQNMHPLTASGEYLDLCADDAGLTRIQATNAIKRVLIYDRDGNLTDLDLSTLITPKGNGSLIYSLNEKESTGTYKARCATAGTVGNSYTGECELLANNSNISLIQMTDLIESARDMESDIDLRNRIREASNASAFGGNIAEYRNLVGTKLTTVGQMQVYPRNFNDPILNSTVVSVVDNDNNPMTNEQLDTVRQILDPATYGGGGRGELPIGHSPVVTTPTEITVNFSMTAVIKAGYSAESVQDNIKNAISEYIDELKENWADIDYSRTDLYRLSVNVSNVIAKAVTVEGVDRINDVLINGQSTDLSLTQNKELQQLPKFGDVIFN